MISKTSPITERRRQTRNRIYRYIFDAEQPVSKQDLAYALRLSMPTIHQNIAELMEAGVIRVGEIGRSTGGRPPAEYVPVPDVRFAIGVSVTADYLFLLAGDLKLQRIASRRIKWTLPKSERIGGAIARAVETFIRDHRLKKQRLLGVGITFPGVISPERDRILLSPTLRMRDIVLEDLYARIPYPVHIENDSTSGGLAEWFLMTPEERQGNFVYLFLGNGIGGAIFMDGKQYPGSNLRSAEFGHMCIVPGGKKCNCGKTGCLEAYCSAFRITRDLKVTQEEFFEEVRKGNKRFKAVWEDVTKHLALAVGNLRMAFDCDVVIGGLMAQELEPYMEELRARCVANSPFGEDGSFVRLGKLGVDASMMGVACHFSNAFLETV